MRLSDFRPICGIYKITNTENGRVYIGQSANIFFRWATHAKYLAMGAPRGVNKNMLSDFQEFGIEAFVVEIIEECDEELLKKRESELIQEFYDKGIRLYNSLYSTVSCNPYKK